MGIDCHGWVEVRDPTTPAGVSIGFPNWWSGVVRIDDIVERNYPVFGYFFDVRNPFDRSVAGRRGLPAHPSRETLASPVGPTDGSATTWITWAELQASQWMRVLELPSGWNLLFTLMARLAEYSGSERVRLVIWFDDGLES